MLGVVVGATIGTRVLHIAPPKKVKATFGLIPDCHISAPDSARTWGTHLIPKIDLYKAIGSSLRAGVLLACLFLRYRSSIMG